MQQQVQSPAQCNTATSVVSSAPLPRVMANTSAASVPETLDLGDQLFRELEEKYKQETGQLSTAPAVLPQQPMAPIIIPEPITKPIQPELPPSEIVKPVSDTIPRDVFTSGQRKRKRGRPRIHTEKTESSMHPRQVSQLMDVRIDSEAKPRRGKYVLIQGGKPHAFPALRSA